MPPKNQCGYISLIFFPKWQDADLDNTIYNNQKHNINYGVDYTVASLVCDIGARQWDVLSFSLGKSDINAGRFVVQKNRH
jgi:hypothetical protein